MCSGKTIFICVFTALLRSTSCNCSDVEFAAGVTKKTRQIASVIIIWGCTWKSLILGLIQQSSHLIDLASAGVPWNVL